MRGFCELLELVAGGRFARDRDRELGIVAGP
jgi:hypothetical protein